MPAKKPRPDEKPQIERFKEKAREIETNDSPEGFDRAFEKVISSTAALKSVEKAE
jgi:hypothetical protein